MGWFLTSKRKTTSKPAKRAARRSKASPTWDPQRTMRWLKISGSIIAILALAAGTWYGRTYLIQQIRVTRAITPQVELVNLPAWLGPWRSKQIVQTVMDTVDANPLDQASLQTAANRLDKNPWIDSIQRLVRKPGGKIEVHAVYRQPAALVAAQDGYHLIDRQAHRLPGVYPFSQFKNLGLIAIVGSYHAPPAAGDPWPGNEVKAGLQLALLISRQSFAKQVTAVDVTNYNGRKAPNKPQLTLITRRSVIQWGRPIGQENNREPLAQKKIQNLYWVASRYHGSIDAQGIGVSLPSDVPMLLTGQYVSSGTSVINLNR